MYSSCSVTCGEGEQSRTRQCVGGICSLAIPDDLIESRSCNMQDCAPELKIVGPVRIGDDNFVTAIQYSDNFEVSFEFKAFTLPSGSWSPYHQILIGK